MEIYLISNELIYLKFLYPKEFCLKRIAIMHGKGEFPKLKGPYIM